MARIIPDMPSPAFVVLIVAVGLLVLIPTRRLFLAGWSSGALSAYYLGMVVLALFTAELRGPARYLIPILVLAYVAPFVTARAGIARIRDRFGGTPPGGGSPAGGPARTARPQPKNVTPEDPGPAEPRR